MLPQWEPDGQINAGDTGYKKVRRGLEARNENAKASQCADRAWLRGDQLAGRALGRWRRLSNADRVGKHLRVRHEHALALRLELGVAQVDVRDAAAEAADIDAVADLER